MADIDILNISSDYSTLLELAKHFSDDGVINFNFLRTLLVNIVEILKRFDDSKMQSTRELKDVTDATAYIGFNKKIQCVESMHDSFSMPRVVGMHDHKGIQENSIKTATDLQTSKLPIATGCQSEVHVHHQANQTKLSCTIQRENEMVLIDASNEIQKFTCDSATTHSLDSHAVSSQTKSIQLCEKPVQCYVESVHDSSSRILPATANNEPSHMIIREMNSQYLNDQFMSEIDKRFAKLENNVHGIVTATNEIVNEIENIEKTLIKDSSEIKNFQYSLECFRQEFDDKTRAENTDRKAAKYDIKVSSTSAQVSMKKLSDKGQGMATN